jgi:hypothetical protein
MPDFRLFEVDRTERDAWKLPHVLPSVRASTYRAEGNTMWEGQKAGSP